jgi:hypothetical protein
MEEDHFLNEAIRRGFLTFEQAKVGAGSGTVKVWDALRQAGLLSRDQVEDILSGAPARKSFPFGPFTIHGRIGEGGMGAVYRATRQGVREVVALKILPRRFGEGEPARRFEREAGLAISLDHPNLVKGIEFGKVGSRWYYSMELLAGKTLAEMLWEERLDEKLALKIAAQIAEALRAFHERGLVHRDIKPDNIMIARDGGAKLMDLGLAKSILPGESTLTQSGCAVGTPHFMAPEQIRGEEADIRSDIYSLGATLYAMVTGRKPHAELSPIEILQKKVKARPVDPRDLRSDLSDGVAGVIRKMMSPDPAARHSTPSELLEDLRQALAGRPLRSVTTRLVRPPPRPRKKLPYRLVLAGSAGALALFGAALLAGSTFERRPQARVLPDPLESRFAALEAAREFDRALAFLEGARAAADPLTARRLEERGSALRSSLRARLERSLHAVETRIDVGPDGRARVRLSYDFSTPAQWEDFESEVAGREMAGNPAIMAFRPWIGPEFRVRTDWESPRPARGMMVRGGAILALARNARGDWAIQLQGEGFGRPVLSSPRTARIEAARLTSVSFGREGGRVWGSIDEILCEAPLDDPGPARLSWAFFDPATLRGVVIEGTLHPDWVRRALEPAAAAR